MGQNDLLALIGAVTGIAGSVLGVAAFLRDHARLVLRVQSVIVSREGPGPVNEQLTHFAYLYAVNAGRQPTAILELGLTDRRILFGRLGKRDITGQGSVIEGSMNPQDRDVDNIRFPILDPSRDEPLVLQPGEMRKFCFVEASEGSRSNGNRRIYRVYALDYRERVFVSKDTVSAIYRGVWVAVSPEDNSTLPGDTRASSDSDTMTDSQGKPNRASR